MKNGESRKKGEGSPTPIVTPLTSGPLTVYNPLTGKAITSNKATLIECCIEIATKCKDTGQMITVALAFNRADINYLDTEYAKRNRPLAAANVQELTRRFNCSEYVEAYPTLFIDWNGVQVNGGHTMAGFKHSNLNTWKFVLTLGVDPKIDLLIDVLKRRDSVAQGFYLPGDSIYTGMSGDKEGDVRKSFICTAGYIFGFGVEYGVFDAGHSSFSKSKEAVVQEPGGVQVIRACQEAFLFVRKMLADHRRKLKKENVGIFECGDTAVFNTPMCILYLAGYKDLLKPIAFGGTEDEKLLAAHDVLVEKISRSDYTAIREQSERQQMTLEVLSHVYAREQGVEAPVLLPRYRSERKEKGSRELILTNVWGRHSRSQKDADKLVRRAIVEFFWNKIKRKL